MAKRSSRKAVSDSKLPYRYSSYSPGQDKTDKSEAPEPLAVKPKHPALRWLLKITAVFLIVLLIFVMVIGIWDARNISAASQKMFGSGNLFSLLNSSGLQTDSSGRVNVLVAGYSADDPGHSGANLTDSIMMLSLNPANHTGYMLSIPRDLYVHIPGYGYGKINEAYMDGGMSLLNSIVSDITGMSIGYNMLVDYSAVRGIVDALGGINVTINSPDGRLYDPNKDWSTGGPLVDLTNGQHHLSGEQALDLSRARGDPSPYGIPVGFAQSDFQRTADQRLVFLAIKSKLNWKLILNPRKNGRILNSIADNVKTNVKPSEARPLFGLFNNVPTSQLQSLSLRDFNGRNYLVSTFYEGDTLTPAAGLDDYSSIQAALQTVQ